MSTPESETPAPRPSVEASPTDPFLDQAVWRQLGEARSDEQFVSSWLALVSGIVGGVAAGVVVLERQENGAFEPIATWPHKARVSSGLEGIVRRALDGRAGAVARNDADGPLQAGEQLFFEIAYPLQDGEFLHGVAALELTPRPQAGLHTAMRHLQWGVPWLIHWVLRKRTEPSGEENARLRNVLEIVGVALEQPTFKASATAAATELATRLNCDRASIGFLKRGQVKVQALSHSAQFGKHMNLIRAIGLAMGECIDQQAALVYPDPGTSGRHVLHAHQQLARVHGDATICTVPLLSHEGKAFGALMIERSVPDMFDDRSIAICESLGAVLGPILEASRRNDRLLAGKIGDSLWVQVKRLFGPRYAVRKVVAAGILLAVLFFTFATAKHRVTAKTTLEGEVRRVVSAPFRGFIFEAMVRSGDIVHKGQPMCSLDVRDLRLENEKTKSEREQAILEQRKAMAAGDRAAVNVLEKKALQSEAQIALFDERISRATITAPFDGIVVNGDLSQSLGAPVDTGQVMFEIAPLEQYRVMMQVDERSIGEVHDGQSGNLVLTSMPRNKLSFKVTKVTPVSKSEEGRNYFVVEGKLDQVSTRLRPGMEGYGKIDVGRRKVIWIWTHETIDWIRMWVWKWIF